MAETTPTNPFKGMPVLLFGTMDSGNQAAVKVDDDGELAVAITIADVMSAIAKLGDLTDIFHTAAAARILLNAYAAGSYSAAIPTGGLEKWRFSFALTWAAATRIDYFFETSLDGTNWDRVQNEVTGTTVTTKYDGEFRKAVTANARWDEGMNFGGAPYFRLAAIGQGAAGADALLVRAMPIAF